MTKYVKSSCELEADLREQLVALRSSISAYDEGKEWEAKRISSSIYILLFDGSGRTQSLVTLTGRKSGMKVYSSVHKMPDFIAAMVTMSTSTSLLDIEFDGQGNVAFVPVLDRRPIKDDQWRTTEEWWSEELFHKPSGISLTRRNVVFSMRTQDGGAHVDRAITDRNYASFSREEDPFFAFLTAEGIAMGGLPPGTSPKNGVKAILRQLAWEVDVSFQKVGL